MQIYFKKSFLKQYQKLRKDYREKVNLALKLFEKNPHDPALKNHALSGKLLGKRSIAAGFDLRIVFEVQEDYLIIIILAVGTHNQVYER